MARLNINFGRLSQRIETLGAIGATPEGGVSRLAFTDADRQGRDQVRDWMNAAGLTVLVDKIGNMIGIRAGKTGTDRPVMTGSHIDTVGNGGKLDGNLGVLAGLEIIETLNDAGLETARPLAVAVFSNEEGVRFQPDMMGSLVYAGGYNLDDALATNDRDGVSLGDALRSIGYDGPETPGHVCPHAFIELHIEQGPVLEAGNIAIGAVDSLQGISWTDITLTGQANHAGTTPMALRRDAAYGAAMIASGVREITRAIGGTQVGTVGRIDLKPNLINVVAGSASLTVDLRNTVETELQDAEARLDALVKSVCEAEGLTSEMTRTVRFDPVTFDGGLVKRISGAAQGRGLSCQTMASGAGHDAQMMARICPSAMIFTPSIKGISHNPAEATHPADLEAGTNVLLDVMLGLAG